MLFVHRILTGAMCALLAATAHAQFAYTECGAEPSLVAARVPAEPADAGREAVGTVAGAATLYGVYWGAKKVSAPLVEAAPVAPPAWMVGAVAVDTYVLPKYTARGCTPSSLFTQTDFNSPPRLLHYKNYLAPMPYTHPPVMPAGKAPFQVTQGPDLPTGIRTGMVSLEY